MTDNTRVSDSTQAAAQQPQPDNFDRTELFSSFDQTVRNQSTDTTTTGTNSSDRTEGQTNNTDAAAGDSSLRTTAAGQQNGDGTTPPGQVIDANGNLQISNVFEDLGLTRSAVTGPGGNQPEGAALRTQVAAARGADRQFPSVQFFDSAAASASSSDRGPQRNRAREQRPGNLRTQQQGPDAPRPERARPGDQAQRPQADRSSENGLQVENLGASKEFADKIQKQFDSLTPETRAALEKAGVQIIVTDNLTNPNVRPDLAGKQPYSQPGTTYENLPGFFLPKENAIVIAEKPHDRNGNPATNSNPEGAVKHEVGHALDKALGNFSQSPEFREAHQKDAAKLNSNPFDRGMFNYLLDSKDGGDGKKETFAEVWSALNGASTDPGEAKLILSKFPNVANLIKERFPKTINIRKDRPFSRSSFSSEIRIKTLIPG